MIAGQLGYPAGVRPSYVLGGRAMEIIRDERASPTCSERYRMVPEDIKARYPNDKTGQINTCSGTNPLLFDSYLTDAIEVDVDALCDGTDVLSPASWSISRKPASIPATAPARCRPHSLARDARRDSSARPKRWPRALNVGRPDERAVRHQGRRDLRARGQPARLAHRALRRQDHRRCRSPRSPRASWRARSSPNPSAMAPKTTAQPHRGQGSGVPVRPFPGVDTLLGPEMRSTGEVMGLTATLPWPSPRPSSAPAPKLPKTGTVFISVRDQDKAHPADGKAACGLGFNIIATGGTQRYLNETGVPAKDQQGAGRPAAYRRRHPQRRGAAGHQHDGRQAGMADSRQAAAPRRADEQGALLHHAGRPNAPKSIVSTKQSVARTAYSVIVAWGVGGHRRR
jgi:carbamoyl-phosphate synthase large subunit